MPVYLKSIGFTVLAIGVLEGVAEAVSGISKGYFGAMSDKHQSRLPFVRFGYGLSALAKPLLALSNLTIWVFTARTADRLGKGIRTAARDALLSDEATPETKGAVFGFHRSMDTTGAVIGPLLALVYLWFAPGQYRPLFYLAFIPGVLSIGLLLMMKEHKHELPAKPKTYSLLTFAGYWKTSPAAYKKLVAGLLLFALFNSSDYFLLLRMKDTGMSDIGIIGIYVFYNVAYAGLSYALGSLGDRIGLKKVLLAGLLVFALVYAGMAMGGTLLFYLLLFALYGTYAAATDGISKAWISNLTARSETATALGTFTAFQSLATMVASALAGFIWLQYGAAVVFGAAAIVAVIVVAYLGVGVREQGIATIAKQTSDL